jgi:hypothetical protein
MVLLERSTSIEHEERILRISINAAMSTTGGPMVIAAHAAASIIQAGTSREMLGGTST